MVEKEKMVPLKEAIEQVKVALGRLTLLHLSFSKTLVEELGEEKGKELIIRSIIEYSRRVVERMKKGVQRLPWYGHHEKCVYSGNEYFDFREIPGFFEGKINMSLLKACGCIVAKIAKEYGEEGLGCLYCYTDPGIAMAANPNHKLIHKDCEACGDEYCTFEILPTTEKERKDFSNKAKDWKYVDPCLVEGANLKG